MERKVQFMRCFSLAFILAVLAGGVLTEGMHLGPYRSLYIAALLGELAYEVMILKGSEWYWRILRIAVLPFVVFLVASVLQFFHMAIMKSPGWWPIAIPGFFMGVLLDQSIEYRPTDGELAIWFVPGAICGALLFFS